MERTEAAQPTSFWSLYWELLAPFRPKLWSVVRWIIVMQAVALAEPWIMTTIVDDIVKHGIEAQPRLWPMALAALGVLLLNGLVKLAKDRRIMDLGTDMYADIQIDCGAKLLRLPLDYHLRTNTGEIIGKVTTGVGKIVDLNFFLVYELIPLFVQGALSAVLLAMIHPYAPLAMIPAITVYVFLTHRFKLKMQHSRRARHDADRKGDAVLGQAVTNIMTVQSFVQEPRELGVFTAMRNANRDLFLREMKVYRRTDLVRNATVSVGRIALLVLCAQLVFGDVVSIGKMILMVTLAEKLFTNCYRLGGVYDRVMDCEEPARQICALLKEPETLKDASDPVALPERISKIAFEDVSFGYTSLNADRENIEVLRSITMTVEPGQMLGIVGQSGAGKSTLAKLLMSFYRPDAGCVRLNGIDIRKIRIADIRSCIGYVPQEVELFDDTIRANIAYGKPNATDEDVVAVAKAANAHEFILQCGGYDTVIGNRGLKLSGGQRQRVGIARALLLKPAILILDEATSSVDPETIWEIKQALQRVRGTCMLIVITHQLATIQDADTILLVKDGRVDGVGKHADLARRNATYRNLVQRQQALDMASRFSDPSRLS